MKIGRNDPCPCGSGKKYKKCCLDKEQKNTKSHIEMNSFVNSFVQPKQSKDTNMNKTLLNIYDNGENMSVQKKIDEYLEVMNGLLDYAEKNNIHTLEQLDNEHLISDFIINVIGDFESEILNLKKEDYDLNKINEYLDKLVTTINLNDNTYENSLRCKTHNLFKLGECASGEKIMIDLITVKHNSIFPYVELVDDYEMVGNLERAKYYYDLGMKQKNLKDLDILEERKYYFEK